jgi:hypothetical protein
VPSPEFVESFWFSEALIASLLVFAKMKWSLRRGFAAKESADAAMPQYVASLAFRVR